MKTSKLFASLLLLAVAVSAGAQSLDKDGDIYLIKTLADWNTLAEYVASGKTCAGQTFRMTADIGTAQEPVTTTMGCQLPTNKTRRRFAGTFDGDGHTLTVSLEQAETNNNYCAPFAYAKNVTIKNLHVKGTISTTGCYAGGLIGSSGNKADDGDCTVQNCHVSVTIISKYKTAGSKYANQGGFIGIAEGNATITDSWFDGAFESQNGGDFKHSGGFIALAKGTATLNNGLFNPSGISGDGTNSRSFAHASDGSDKAEGGKDLYYVTSFGEASVGQQVNPSLPTGKTAVAVKAADARTYYIPMGQTGESSMAGQTRYWTTFFDSANNYKLSAGSYALTMDKDGNLYMVGKGSVVPKNCAVVIMSDTPTVKFTVTNETATPEAGNVLAGTDEETDTPAGDVYVMGLVGEQFSLVRYEGAKIPAHKAYIVE